MLNVAVRIAVLLLATCFTSSGTQQLLLVPALLLAATILSLLLI
jgi:hypothetical protein